MLYVSKITPSFFLLAMLNLFLSLLFMILPGFNQTFFITLVFGFIGSTIMGAMYQIVPNSQNRKLSAEFISYLVFLGVITSLSLFYIKLYLPASINYFMAVSLFFLHIVLNIKNWMPVTVKFLALSATFFLVSSLFLLLHNFGILPLQLAIHTFTVGTMLSAVYGVEIAWIPMLMMEAINIKRLSKLFYLKLISTPLLLLSFYLLNYRLIAVSAILEIGVAAYFLYLLYDMFSKRRMSTPPPPAVKIFMSALILLPIGLVVGFLMASAPNILPYMVHTHIILLVYGFTALTIFGGIFHLLPRIVWNWKLKDIPKAPTINQLVDEKDVPNFLFIFFLNLVLFVMLNSIEPVRYLAPLPYLVSVGLFLKITFFQIYTKLTEVRDGTGKQTSAGVQSGETDKQDSLRG